MTTNRFWDLSTLGLSVRLLAAALLWTQTGGAQSLEQMVRRARTVVEPGDLSAIQRVINAHPKDQTGSLARFALGVIQVERKDYQNGLENLRAGCERLREIEDFCALYKQAAHQGLEDYGSVRHEFSVVTSARPASPLVQRAALVTAASEISAQKPADAVEILRKHFGESPDAKSDLVLGAALESAGDLHGAAVAYQHAYYRYPLSQEASDAEAALRRIAATQALPPPTTTQTLTRAYVLLDRGDASKAKEELTAVLPYLPASDKELAQVRIGSAYLKLRQPAEAIKALDDIKPSAPEVDAERLYLLQSAAWRLERETDALRYLSDLAQAHPASSWRLKALDAAGSRFVTNNDSDRAAPLFQACAEAAPKDALAASCSWKYLWIQYMHHRLEAESLLKAYLATYPDSEKANAALYYLGRIAERKGDLGTARVLYQEIAGRFPNTYYAMLARKVLAQPSIARAAAPETAVAYLASIPFASRPAPPSFAGNASISTRLARARLLEAAGLNDLAEIELRFAATRESQPQVIALELAENSARVGTFDQSIRWIKRYAPEYLNLDLEQAPQNFWRYAFPLPYREDLESNARSRSLDPFLVAALIRQESEFNPKVVSRAKAYGLTQVLPSTGRQLSRRLGYRSFSADMLFRPSFNMELGAYYLRSLIDSLHGSVEAALASYNAGKSRVDRWMTWNDYREPSEFVESIPFNETRNYVQIVLRNADMYRRLYAGKASLVPSPNGNSSGH